MENQENSGKGTEESPFVVVWIDENPWNPLLYSNQTRWFITIVSVFITIPVSVVSSAYSGGADEILAEFNCSEEVLCSGHHCPSTSAGRSFLRQRSLL